MKIGRLDICRQSPFFLFSFGIEFGNFFYTKSFLCSRFIRNVPKPFLPASFSKNLSSSRMSVYVYICPHFHVIYFEASHGSSDHMISLRPLIGQPSFPTYLAPPPPCPPTKKYKKLCNISKIVLVLLFASVKIFFVSRMRDFGGSSAYQWIS